MCGLRTAVGYVAEFISITDIPAFARAARETRGISVTAAQILDAPLDNVILDATPNIFIGMSSDDISTQLAALLPGHQTSERDCEYFTLIARLRAWLLDTHSTAAIAATGVPRQMTAYDVMCMLRSLLLRNHTSRKPTSSCIWEELVGHRQGAMQPDDLFDVSPAVRYLSRGWMEFRPGHVPTIREVVLILNHIATSLIFFDRGDDGQGL